MPAFERNKRVLGQCQNDGRHEVHARDLVVLGDAQECFQLEARHRNDGGARADGLERKQ